jgi:hypothetical protein
MRQTETLRNQHILRLTQQIGALEPNILSARRIAISLRYQT